MAQRRTIRRACGFEKAADHRERGDNEAADQETGECIAQEFPPRLRAAGVARVGILQIGNHSFRATGITEYVRNGGKLEIA
jgi:hypothetical protein